MVYGTISNMIEFGYGVYDAFWRVVWAIDEGTVWAEGFSEESFLEIKKGMSKIEVEQIMGKPLNTTSEEFWFYATQDQYGTSDFDQRWIVFDTNNKVTEIRKSFFID